MNEKGNGVLCRYSFTVNRTGRAKGAVLLDTDEGYYLLKEYKGTTKRLEFEHQLLKDIHFPGGIMVDYIIEDTEGRILNEDEDGLKYVVRKWYDAKDMDSKNLSQVVKAAGVLGMLHNQLERVKYENSYINQYFNIDEIGKQILEEFVRHNREIKRTRNFVRDKRRKNEFELMVLSAFEEFYQEGMEVVEDFEKNDMNEFVWESLKKGSLVHGSFNYHNIIIAGDKMVVTNFEHAKCGIQIRDLYDYIRKVMEKHGWNGDIGYKLIREYERYRKITPMEWQYLCLKLKYPEKYWKILNHYNNNNKAWIPDKDIKKLKLVIEQQEKKRDFVNSLLNLP